MDDPGYRIEHVTRGGTAVVDRLTDPDVVARYEHVARRFWDLAEEHHARGAVGRLAVVEASTGRTVEWVALGREPA